MQWDGFVSCFFVDTAPNVLEYVQLIAKLLKPGGVWLNHGPLTYHFADPYSELSEAGWLDARYHESVELSWEEVRHALGAGGFRIDEEATGLPAHYTLNDR
jgi:carnosine N-methyltransferase